MAWIGLPFYGYCPMTVTTNDDGTEQESLGAGKITKAVISYAGENDSDSSELWAGDRREQRDNGAPSAKLTIDRSFLSLEDEAELGGHHYDASTTVSYTHLMPSGMPGRLCGADHPGHLLIGG